MRLSRRQLLSRMAVGAAAVHARWVTGDRAWASGEPGGWWCDLPGGDRALTGTTHVRAAPAAGDPAEVGRWSASVPGPFPVIGVHAAVLHTGWVLLLRGTDAYVWDPVTGDATAVDAPLDAFCAGQTTLPAGDVLFAGGKDGPTPAGSTLVMTFKPATLAWTVRPPMAAGRFYPTTTVLPDGRCAITSGYEQDGVTVNPDVDVYDSGSLTKVAELTTGIYPKHLPLPDGRVLVAGPERKDTYVVDPSDWSIADVANLGVKHHNGGAVRLADGRVLVVGGNGTETSTTGRPTSACEAIDPADLASGWSEVASLPQGRAHANLVQLPDRSVLCVGGGNSAGPTRTTLRYEPGADTWTPMAAQAEQRRYHSTAVLLPDGRVLSAGDTTEDGGGDRLEVYSPPYLFRGPRPAIATAPTQVRHGEAFNVGTPSTVGRVALLRAGATTHALDMSQLHVDLAFTPAGGRVRVTAPASGGEAPPGYYLLFLVSPDGVPSVGRFVRVLA